MYIGVTKDQMTLKRFKDLLAKSVEWTYSCGYFTINNFLHWNFDEKICSVVFFIECNFTTTSEKICKSTFQFKISI